jgi:hypothetical protein
MTDKEKLIDNLFENKLMFKEDTYSFTNDALIIYAISDNLNIQREFRASGEEIVRKEDGTEAKGKERNARLKRLNAQFTGRNRKTTPTKD